VAPTATTATPLTAALARSRRVSANAELANEAMTSMSGEDARSSAAPVGMSESVVGNLVADGEDQPRCPGEGDQRPRHGDPPGPRRHPSVERGEVG